MLFSLFFFPFCDRRNGKDGGSIFFLDWFTEGVKLAIFPYEVNLFTFPSLSQGGYHPS